MHWWVHSVYQSEGPVALASWIVWVLLSISLHELGHGWAAIRQGDRTPIELDRMTLNPLVHMGTYSLLLFAICGIAWGLMPVNPRRFRDGRRGEIFVAAAGPAVNVLLAVACILIATAWLALVPEDRWAYSAGAVFLYHGIFLNALLAIINLLPIPPLDGSRILAGFSNRADRLFAHPNAPMIGLFVFIAIFASGIGGEIWRVASRVTHAAVDAVGRPVGNPPMLEAMLPELLDAPAWDDRPMIEDQGRLPAR